MSFHVSPGPSCLFFIRQRLCFVSLERGSYVDLFVSLPRGLACLLPLLLQVAVFQEQTPHCWSSTGLCANSLCLKWGVVSIQKPFYPQIWTICFSINLTGKSICIPIYSFFVSHLGSGLDRGRNEFFLGLPPQSFQILIINLLEYPYTEWS